MTKFNMAEQLQMIQKLQKEMSKLQDQLEEMAVEGSSGGGMVVATVNGKQRVLSVTIDPEVVSKDDVEMLEDLVAAAVNQALDKSKDMAQEQMQNITGGMLGSLPGGLKIPGLPF